MPAPWVGLGVAVADVIETGVAEAGTGVLVAVRGAGDAVARGGAVAVAVGVAAGGVALGIGELVTVTLGD